MSVWFTKDSALGRVLLDWWKGLVDDRAGRAILRRAESVTAVALSPPYQQLFRRLCAAGWPGNTKHLDDRLAAAVGLLAHVEFDDDRAPAEAMSRLHDSDSSDRPLVSELRFRRVLESPDLDALFVGIRRLLPLMHKRVSVLALTNDIIHWDDSVKKAWAYKYAWPEKSTG